jgi:hypothetical protein
MVTKGIYPGMGMDEYHGWKLEKSKLIEGPISCSMLKSFAPNPYAWLKSPEFKPTKAMETGSLFDAAVTDPDTLGDLLPMPKSEPFAELPFADLRTKAAKEWKAEKEKEGVRVLTPSQSAKEREAIAAEREAYEERLNHLSNAAKQVRLHDVAGPIMEGAEFQVGVVGEIGGIPAKCLLDILPSEDGDYPETIFDYKTISTGLDDDSIRNAIGKYRYHWQAAYYRTLFSKVSEDRLCSDFGFIFQDTKTLEVRVVMLDDDALALGTRAVGEALKDYAKCAHRGIRSKYRKSISTLDLMPYHAMSEDERLTKEETE